MIPKATQLARRKVSPCPLPTAKCHAKAADPVDGTGNFAAGNFHPGGFRGFNDPGDRDDDAMIIGGRFFYHVHSTLTSDFSVGGSLGYVSQNNPPPVDREGELYIEPAIQIRAFIVSNVALSFNVGVSIGVMDAESVDLGGQLVGGSLNVSGTNLSFGGGAGVHYYFF